MGSGGVPRLVTLPLQTILGPCPWNLSRSRTPNIIATDLGGHTITWLQGPAMEPLLPESCPFCRRPTAACRRWSRRSNKACSECRYRADSSVHHRRPTPKSCHPSNGPQPLAVTGPEDRITIASGPRIPVFAPVVRLQNLGADGPKLLAVAGPEDRRKRALGTAIARTPVFASGESEICVERGAP